MSFADPFAGLKTIGQMAPQEATAVLRELLPAGQTPSRELLGGFGAPKAWQYGAHAFGFIENNASEARAAIHDVGSIAPDVSLAGARITISLNYLRIAEYPGSGTHQILFDFSAQNQTPSQSEIVHFNATYRVQQGGRLGVRGYPIFVGLTVGMQGLTLRCFTVNVSNIDDERFLTFLDSDLFKNGLQLVSAAQPALAPLSGMAVGITKAIAARNRNVPVQDIYLGLGFDRVPGGARLAEGAYIAVQVPENNRQLWTWDDWDYDAGSGQITKKTDSSQLIPYNYLIFGINRYRETA